jgi:hypothetical protein
MPKRGLNKVEYAGHSCSSIARTISLLERILIRRQSGDFGLMTACVLLDSIEARDMAGLMLISPMLVPLQPGCLSVAVW